MKIILITSQLGNQMFQYAFKYAFNEDEEIFFDFNYFKNDLSRVFNLKVPTVNKKHNTKNLGFLGYLLLRKNNFLIRLLIRIIIYPLKILKVDQFFKKKTKIFTEKRYKQKNWVFHQYTKEELEGSTTFLGHFQNPKYFDHKRNQVLKDFSFPEIKEPKNIEILEKIKNCDSVSIHVRLSDYLTEEGFFNLSKTNYYQESIKEIKQKIDYPTFFIFSDDIKSCKKLFRNLENCYFIDWNQGSDSFKDMQLMSLCKNNIIANSTFSFWAAYLNKNENKIVIAPDKFFSDEGGHIEYDKKWKVLTPKEINI